jgi:hypothetical protein
MTACERDEERDEEKKVASDSLEKGLDHAS